MFCAFVATIIENMYPPLSSRTVTKGENEGVSNGDVLAFGRMVKLDLSLSTLLVAGGLPQ